MQAYSSQSRKRMNDTPAVFQVDILNTTFTKLDPFPTTIADIMRLFILRFCRPYFTIKFRRNLGLVLVNQ